MLVFPAAFGIYLANVAVGVLAWRHGKRFGAAHHILFAMNCVATALAAWQLRTWFIYIVLVCLAVMPRTRPHGVWHRRIALLGLASYGAAAVQLAIDAGSTMNLGATLP